MGYRKTVVEDKTAERLFAARRGETEITIDRGGLTDSKAEYSQDEIRRRIERGKY